MVRDIVYYGSKVLRRKADPVQTVDDAVRSLIRDLFDSLAEAEGVGLAAPQIGVSRRVIVVDISNADDTVPPIALVNPVIEIGQGMATAEEGCLSIPDLYGDVPRYTNIDVSALDQNGEPFRFNAEGFYARVRQHEIDVFLLRESAELAVDPIPVLRFEVTAVRKPPLRQRVTSAARSSLPGPTRSAWPAHPEPG